MKQLRIPPILCDLIQTTFSSCDGLVFDHYRNCPECGGSATGYDRRQKNFAILNDGSATNIIHVYVKRFSCNACGNVFSASAPFYPKTRVGSPIVDLCVTLGQTMHYPRVSANLAFLGLIIDRWTVRNYILSNGERSVPTTELYGIRVPLSLVNLTVLFASRYEKETIHPLEVLEACGIPP